MLSFFNQGIFVLAYVQESERGRGDFMCLNEVGRDHRFISYRKMDNESNLNFNSLLDHTSSTHISSLNLLTCVSCICNIAQLRPQFMQRVIGKLFSKNHSKITYLADSDFHFFFACMSFSFPCRFPGVFIVRPSSEDCWPALLSLLSPPRCPSFPACAFSPSSSSPLLLVVFFLSMYTTEEDYREQMRRRKGEKRKATVGRERCI